MSGLDTRLPRTGVVVVPSRMQDGRLVEGDPLTVSDPFELASLGWTWFRVVKRSGPEGTHTAALAPDGRAGAQCAGAGADDTTGAVLPPTQRDGSPGSGLHPDPGAFSGDSQ